MSPKIEDVSQSDNAALSTGPFVPSDFKEKS